MGVVEGGLFPAGIEVFPKVTEGAFPLVEVFSAVLAGEEVGIE